MMNFQAWLDRVAASFFADDFATYAMHFATPFVLVTTTETLIAERTDDLRRGFDEFRDMLHSQGATDLIRLAHGVQPLGSTLLIGRYETHILRSGTRIFDPYPSAAVLRLTDGVWKASAVANSLTNRQWPIHLPMIDTAPDGAPRN